MIGTSERARSSRQTVKPSTSGSRRSSSTMSGSSAASASAPVRRADDLEALSAQPLGERLGDRVVVLDQQYPHGHIVAGRAVRCLGVLPILCQALACGWPDPCRRAPTVRRHETHARTSHRRGARHRRRPRLLRGLALDAAGLAAATAARPGRPDRQAEPGARPGRGRAARASFAASRRPLRRNHRPPPAADRRLPPPAARSSTSSHTPRRRARDARADDRRRGPR